MIAKRMFAVFIAAFVASAGFLLLGVGGVSVVSAEHAALGGLTIGGPGNPNINMECVTALGGSGCSNSGCKNYTPEPNDPPGYVYNGYEYFAVAYPACNVVDFDSDCYFVVPSSNPCYKYVEYDLPCGSPGMQIVFSRFGGSKNDCQ